MNIEIKAHVVDLLESYQKREKQIELLHYELSHSAHVSENELIEALALSHGDGSGSGHPGGHASDKTLYIALNYQEKIKRIHADVSNEIVNQLIALEKGQQRLKYYVSLLDERQKKVVQLSYFEGMGQDKVADQMAVSDRYIRSIKAKAINELASMYEYVNGLNQECS